LSAHPFDRPPFAARIFTLSETTHPSRPADQSRWADLRAEGRLPRFLLICFAIWMNASDTLVTATIMPSVGRSLQGYQYFSWAVAAFLVGAIFAGTSAGWISEVLGLRRATILSTFAFAIGCTLSAAAPNMGFFLVGRLIQGIGSGWISGLAMVAIAFLFPQHLLARVFGAAAAIWGIATVLGPLLGGIAADIGSWRVVFWLFGAQALLFAGAAAYLLRPGIVPKTGSKVPWAQLSVLLAAIFALALADVSGGVLSMLLAAAIGVALLAWFVRIDARAAVRLLPRDAVNLKTTVGRGYVSMFALTTASVGLLVYGPALVQQLRGFSPLEGAYLIVAHAMAWSVTAIWVSGRPEATMPRWIRVGVLAILAGPILLALTMPSGALIPIMAAAAIMGAGFGLSHALMNRRVLMRLTGQDRATGSSALIAVRQVGEVIGAIVVGATANMTGFAQGQPIEALRHTAFWIFASAIPLAALGALSAWAMTRPDGHGTAS
jgi:MFS family permease